MNNPPTRACFLFESAPFFQLFDQTIKPKSISGKSPGFLEVLILLKVEDEKQQDRCILQRMQEEKEKYIVRDINYIVRMEENS